MYPCVFNLKELRRGKKDPKGTDHATSKTSKMKTYLK